MAMNDPYAQIDPMQTIGQPGIMNAIMPTQPQPQQQQQFAPIAPPAPPSTPDMIDQLIQDTINDTTLNKDVQAKVILTLAQAIDTLAKPELEMLKLQQQQQPTQTP